VLVNTSKSYLDEFKEVVEKHKRRIIKNRRLQKLKELKFSKLKDHEKKNVLYDLVMHRHIAIHIERGTSQNPSEIVDKILKSLKGENSKRTLIFDDNFMDKEKMNEFAKKGQKVITSESHKVYGIQIADMIAGSIRSHFEGQKSFVKIIDSKICENSKKIIHPSI
jgi:hypothetical protein